MKMLVGLGNPGKRYRRTRHNVGFRLVDRIAQEKGVRIRWRLLVPAWHGDYEEGGEKIHLAKPRTYMNRSGGAVGRLLERYGLDVADLVVAYDDVALDVGQLRLRESGSAGGHNGVQSVIDELSRRDFLRIRIGVGGPGRRGNLVEHVLGSFTSEEEKSINAAIERGVDLFDSLLRDGPAKTMSSFNNKVNEK